MQVVGVDVVRGRVSTVHAIAKPSGGLAVVTDNGAVTGRFNYSGAVDAGAGPLSCFGGTAYLQLESFTLTDNASGETVGQGVVVGGDEAVVTKTKTTTGTWQTDVTVHADLPGLTAAQEAALIEQGALHQIDFNLQNFGLAGTKIGQIFGSSLGQAIADDNLFAQDASSRSATRSSGPAAIRPCAPAPQSCSNVTGVSVCDLDGSSHIWGWTAIACAGHIALDRTRARQGWRRTGSGSDAEALKPSRDGSAPEPGVLVRGRGSPHGPCRGAAAWT